MNERTEENLPALPSTPMEMIARAVAMGADPTTLERLLAMQERYEANEARKAFKKAISAARGKIKPIFKNREANIGPGRRQPYEDLAEIERSVVPILSDYGLSYRFRTQVIDKDTIVVTCFVEHRDGHFEDSALPGGPDTSGSKSALQAIGSTVPYLKRQTLKAALGLSTTDKQDIDDDDDGAGGGQEKISEMETAQLRKKIEQVKQTEERVCTHYKIAKLEDLPAEMFDRVMNALKPQT